MRCTGRLRAIAPATFRVSCRPVCGAIASCSVPCPPTQAHPRQIYSMDAWSRLCRPRKAGGRSCGGRARHQQAPWAAHTAATALAWTPRCYDRHPAAMSGRSSPVNHELPASQHPPPQGRPLRAAHQMSLMFLPNSLHASRTATSVRTIAAPQVLHTVPACAHRHHMHRSRGQINVDRSHVTPWSRSLGATRRAVHNAPATDKDSPLLQAPTRPQPPSHACADFSAAIGRSPL